MTLEEYIDKHKLSQRDAAAKFSVSETTISRLLSKRRKPGFALKHYIKIKTKGVVSIEDWL